MNKWRGKTRVYVDYLPVMSSVWVNINLS